MASDIFEVVVEMQHGIKRAAPASTPVCFRMVLLYQNQSQWQALRYNPAFWSSIPKAVAIPCGSVIIHSMMKNETQLTREDVLELILEHAANQGIHMDEESLRGYSFEGLYNVLLDLEANI